ncbi:choice-of-anchor I family protein [Roseivivax sediminis]|uniref:Alkaline phosphatase n=1 Tax=Roseivivax sediminis TaxID=936889 RepID=A0A1I2CG47_9RHOB|nr:choice-of-anchor I family protein [Roseivivax sediminis]SFE67224.1 alkaline phosphatase [Roseivivax sediminis]
MPYTLQLLHANDLEGGVEALDNAPNFAAIVDSLDDTYENTVTISSGDNYIPGVFFSTAADFSFGGILTDAYARYYTEVLGLDADTLPELDLGRGAGRVDVSIMNFIGFDASAVGNHEFDAGTSAFSEIIGAEGSEGVVEWAGSFFPYLSANLDFSGDGNLSGLATDEILFSDRYNETLEALAAGEAGPSIAPATIIKEGGERIGVVGATTQIIESISSTGGVDETSGGANDMAALAEVLQPQIDALIADGVNKIIVTSHLQQFALEQELAGLLSGVDIIIAGGSNTLQADEQDTLRDGDEAEETYPFATTNADGEPTLIVGTDGEYSYVGRLVVTFDDNGVVDTSSVDAAESGVFATDEAGTLAATGADSVEEAIDGSTRADIVEDLTSAVAGIVEERDGVIYGAHEVFLDGRRESVRTEETNLGNLTADANLAAAREVDDNIVVSFKNGGGIRAEIGSVDADGTPTEGDGLVSQLDVENSLRFDNGLALFDVTKEGLKQLLEHAVAATDTEAGSTPGQFAQIGGLRFSFDETQTAQDFATNEDGDYIPAANGTVETATAGERVQTIAIVDPETGEDIVVYRDGGFTGAAPDTIGMVALDFLVNNNGDSYPFQELATNIRFVTDDGTVTTDPDADNILGEQQAFREYLEANFADEDNAFDNAEVSPSNDTRIVQLAQNGGQDFITIDEPDRSIRILRDGQLDSGETELFTGGSEVVSVDGAFAYVTNAAQDQIDIFSTATLEKVGTFDLTEVEGYAGVQSVAAKNGLIAAAINVEDEDGNAVDGVVVLYDEAGTLLNTVAVGNLPDMVTFNADGSTILVANEGEPTDAGNPQGSVSVIDVSSGAAAATVTTLDFTAFDGMEDELREAGVLLEPGVSVSEDLEPEYITVLPGGEEAWVSLQEANAYAVIDLVNMEVTDIRSFGLTDRGEVPFDASNDDNAINLQTYDNVFGMRQPDAIASYEFEGETYIVSANEGDARDDTETEVGDVELDPTAFPNAEVLQRDENLGPQGIRSDLGDTDGDGDYDELYAYGSRSFTVLDTEGNVVFDSGAQFSRLIAEIRPELFNQDEGDFDDRSDNKGVEPEAVAVGMVDGRPLAFIGLERDNGVFVFDLSNPENPSYVNYIDSEAYGNISPEVIDFVPASESIDGTDKIYVSYEGDGNTAVYTVSGINPGVSLVAGDAGELLLGGNLDDDLTGGAGRDLLFGRIGADVIDGGDGDDVIGAGAGRDIVYGGGGDDMIGGGFGDDVIDGGTGNDTIGAGGRNDRVTAGDGDDVVAGGSGNDTLDGGNGDDTMGGGFQDDMVMGGAGDDSLGGGNGMDTISGGEGDDAIGGGLGSDLLSGGAGDDFIAGGGRDDTIDGGDGDDVINGGVGSDVLTGGDGADIFVFRDFGAGDADVITDFVDGTDMIRVIGQGGFGALSITDGDDGAVVAVADTTITLTGLDAADLSTDDFLFV